MADQPTMYVFPPAYAVQHPAERLRVTKLASGVAERMGWTPVFSPLLDQHPGPGCWLPAEERRADLLRALEHPVLWAYRGGYGSVHLLETLLNAPRGRARLLLGYSDVTVLHALWRGQQRGRGIYAALPEHLEGTRAGTSFLDLLRNAPLSRNSDTDRAARVLRPGRATGVSFAACVTVLSALCGTPAQPSLDGALLFLEDVDERPYRIDFALHQLHHAGVLRGVRGLVCGSFKHQNPSEYQGPSMEEILSAWAERLNVPALARLPFGHWDDPLAVPVGVRMELDCGAGGWALRSCEGLLPEPLLAARP